ncbi:DUF86 domain-containing protein [Intrasporangium sp.]|uniref:HepT-like ribonuclease domain-containing protein n=1 Tax=Intrasporangium sp. TaxID=1925024 RepID=UPI003464552B
MSFSCCVRSVDAGAPIRDLVGSRSAERVEADGIRRPALLWHFTDVLGEAASQVPSQVQESHPEIAWRAAARLRNRIVHGYWDMMSRRWSPRGPTMYRVGSRSLRESSPRSRHSTRLTSPAPQAENSIGVDSPGRTCRRYWEESARGTG